MKAKYYIGILSLLLLTSTVRAQRNDPGYNSNDDAKLVVNNYYSDNDYDYSSRINRFHRSYSAFDYYSPVFTDSYIYNYQPWDLGLNMYGGLGFGFNYGYRDYYGYDPYFGGNYYGGYDPFYYNSWFSPFIFNFNFGNRWRNNYYGWNGYYHNHGYNDFRNGYYSNNNHNGYNSNRYSSPGYPSRRNPGNNPGSSTYNNNVSRRGVSSGSYARNDVSNTRSVVRSDNNVRSSDPRRISNTVVNRGQSAGTRNIENNGNYGNRTTGVSNSRRINTNVNSRSINSGVSNNRYNNNLYSSVSNSRNVRSGTGIYSHSSRTSGAPQVRSSSSRSMSSGSATRSASSHSSSRSSGSKSGSSGGKSSGRR
jgi:hypothetical protein